MRRTIFVAVIVLVYVITGATLLSVLPTLVTVYPAIDSYSWESVPFANNGGSNNFEITSYDKPPNNMRGWMAFTLPNVPADALFLNSKLRLRIWHKTTDDPSQGIADPTGRLYGVYRVTSPWAEFNVSWANQPSYTETHSTVAPVPPGQGGWDGPLLWMEWDVTDILKDWLQGAPNYGVLVKDTQENAPILYSTQFFAHNKVPGVGHYPRLIITYMTPTALAATVGIIAVESILVTRLWRKQMKMQK